MGSDGPPNNRAAHSQTAEQALLGSVVAHGDWQLAYDSLLTALLRGPDCLLLLGSPGTGKTLLLRELARSLRRRGRDVQLLVCGDLPLAATAEADRVLLIDEAARMERGLLARLAATPPCPLVLAGLPELEAVLETPPARIQLRELEPREARRFVIDWLVQAGKSPRLSIPAIEQLLLHAAGVPRVLVQLMKAALFMAAGESLITPRDIDEVAAFRGE